MIYDHISILFDVPSIVGTASLKTEVSQPVKQSWCTVPIHSTFHAVQRCQVKVRLYGKIAHTETSQTRFHVLTVASMKMTVFWDVAPCSRWKFTEVSEVLATSIIRATMEAENISETSVNFYHTTRRNIPEDCHLQRNATFIRRRNFPGPNWHECYGWMELSFNVSYAVAHPKSAVSRAVQVLNEWNNKS
jgi:hypothetical protein